MFNRILIPTDFSVVANNALDYAVKLATVTGSALDLLHVQNIPVMDASFPPDVYQTFMAEMEKVTAENFQQIEDTYLKDAGIEYKIHTAVGFVTDEVAGFAEDHKTNLILVGTTGASGIEEMLVGSNAASIIGKSHVPVLVIPPTSVYHEIRHIVYSTDYNEPEFPAVSKLLYFAGLYEATVSVVHVRTESDRYFESEKNFFSSNRNRIPFDKWSMVKLDTEDVLEGIEQYIQQHQTDLLVMAKHNRSFFDRLFHRSLSKQMAYHTKIPLLVLNKV